MIKKSEISAVAQEWGGGLGVKGEDVIQTELLWLSYNWTKVLELTKTSTFGGYIPKYASVLDLQSQVRGYQAEKAQEGVVDKVRCTGDAESKNARYVQGTPRHLPFQIFGQKVR